MQKERGFFRGFPGTERELERGAGAEVAAGIAGIEGGGCGK
jgi:hypothetical protein